jgi:hypothetical protein
MFPDELARLEARAEAGFFSDYREAGSALSRIKDSGAWKARAASWGKYIEETFGISRQHSYSVMNAALVAEEVSAADDKIRLPQRHAAMLYVFNDSEERVRLAREIQHLKQSDAFEVVRRAIRAAESAEPDQPGAPRQEVEEGRESLRLLDGLLATAAALNLADLQRDVSSLRQQDRARLVRRVGRAAGQLRRLITLVERDS